MKTQTRKIAFAAVLIVALFSAGYAVGQNTQPDTTEFEKEIQDVQYELTSGTWARASVASDKVISLTGKAVGNSSYTAAITKQAIARSYLDTDTKSEIRLQALQVAQNQRIIELLEKLADEKK